MLAEKKCMVMDHAAPRPRRRRKRSLLRSLARNQMFCVLLLAGVATLIFTAYVGAYAKFTEKGYRRAELVSRLNSVKKENEKLRLELDMLKQPAQIEQFAAASGMKQGEQLAYLGTTGAPKMAQNIAWDGMR